MIYRIEIRDRDMNFVNVLDNRVSDITWNYSPVGGCAEFSFKASSKYCSELDFGANFNIRIYIRNSLTRNYDLVYQGRIENVTHEVNESLEMVAVQGYGYQSELADLIVNRNYSSTEISVIVKDILDQDVLPNSNITYDVADLENTGFTPDSIKFSYVSALDALQKLADICGSREWGLNKNRAFFFKAQSSAIGFRYLLDGEKVAQFKIDYSSKDIGNRMIVVGGDISGNKYVYVKDDTKSQRKYKRRDRIIQNSAVTTSQVASQLADAKLAELKYVSYRGSVAIVDSVIMESSVPLGLLKIITREIKYNEKKYNTFLYGGQDSFRISKIIYKISEGNILSKAVEFGQLLPSIVEEIKQLDYRINNVVQSGA